MKRIFLFSSLLLQFACVSSEDEKNFIKDYKLLKLDGEPCGNCIIRVLESHTYDIIKDGKVVGEGSWSLKKPIDLPGYDLKLENGPESMIYESDTVIEYINRLK